ncbi:putative non-LTR retroelement reverse transcriptase, partial [Trifolium medium]|nr:putative non-LTR retroelement reverse transcriptase [Trifolium medium]
TDGASKGIDRLSGCGNLVHDENGRWVVGFTRNLGTTIWPSYGMGIHEGLCIARNCGVRQLEVQLDSKIIHVNREANRCADIMANIGCVAFLNTIVYDQPSQELIQVLVDDCRGVSFPRLIAL